MKLFQSKFLFLALLCFGVKSTAQFSTTVPLDPDVASGKLKNGMKYYVLHNEWPKDRVSFYFAQNVGAILENEDQNGLAHFLEHMAFNGTQNFDGKGIIDMLEKNGVRFGSDINAYTAMDQTVYNLSNVPVKNNKLIDSCLLVLHDWSGFLSLKDAEIDAERGVIREEWRTRNTADFRLRAQTNKVLFKGSKYADKDVIGDMNIINNFKYQTLRDYYEKWYRPDLQAVIVVGDIDVKEVEKKIIKLFSAIEMPQNAARRDYEAIPDNKSMDYVLAKDKETQQTKICIYYKKEYDKVKNEESLKKDLINSLGINMLNRRYQEYIQNGETASIGLGAGTSEISRLSTSFNLIVIPKNGRAKEGFKELIVEMERACRYGFTQKELDRNKESILSYYENLRQNKDKISNDNLAEQLTNNFLKASPFESVEQQYKNVQARLESISLSQVNEALKAQQTTKNMLLMVTGPDKKGIDFPSKSDYLKIISDVKKMSLERYKDADTDKPLIEENLKGSVISKETQVAGISNARQYVLSNGAKVVVYPTTLAKDQILFTAFSKGGSSLIKTEDIPSSQIAVNLLENSGLGSFKNSELQDKLNGKIVSITPYINDLTEGFQGSSNQKDMETLLQLLYMYFEHPRFDQDSYNRMMGEYKNALENSVNNSGKVFQDTISLLNSNHNPRVPVFNQHFLDQISFEKAQHIYRERISNASDFSFFFVGNLPENALSLIEKYIGSISSVPKTENFVNHHIEPADGAAKQVLIRDLDVPKASVYLKFMHKAPYNYKKGFIVYLLSELLSKKYMDLIREEEGGSYGVNVNSSVNRLPDDSYTLTIAFDSDPEKEKKLTKIIYEQIELIQKSLADPSVIQSIKNNIIKSRAEQVLSNGFWLNSLSSMTLLNDSFKDDGLYKKTVEEITAEDIKNFAREFFAQPKSVEVIMKSKSPKTLKK